MMIKPIPPAGDDEACPERADQAPSFEPEGGEAACWAHLVCPECGAITSEGHRSGCAHGHDHRACNDRNMNALSR
jgi:hypothetical protein